MSCSLTFALNAPLTVSLSLLWCFRHSGGEAKTWDPNSPHPHSMSGVDFALFHGNVRTFDVLVSLRRGIFLGRQGPLVDNARLDDGDLVSKARE